MGKSRRNVLDLHFHSVFSDGILSPETLAYEAAAAAGEERKISALALSDHNSYAGCEAFLSACARLGINAFVSSEISGSHPTCPDIEFHFLAILGPKWDAHTAERAGKFTAWFNRLHHNDLENVFAFLEIASRKGIDVSFSDIVKSAMRYSQRSVPPAYRCPNFGDLRYMLRLKGIGTKDSTALGSFEREMWKSSGTVPLPTPSITECYDLFRDVRPYLILAHPSYYGVAPEILDPLVSEWKREIGLRGIESHYMGRMEPRWRDFARKHNLEISSGSDSHIGFFEGRSEDTWNKYFPGAERGAKSGSPLFECESSDSELDMLLQNLEGAASVMFPK